MTTCDTKNYVQMAGDAVGDATLHHRWRGARMWVLCCGLLSAGVLMVLCGNEQGGIINLASVLRARLSPVFARPVSHHVGYRPSFRLAGQEGLHGRQYRLQPWSPLTAQSSYGVSTVVRAIGTEEGEVEVVTSEEQFDNILATFPGLVVLDVYTTWCGPCKLFAPKFEGIAAELGGKAKFLKMNVDDNESTDKMAKMRLKTKSVPSFYFYVGGELKDEMKGVDETTFRTKMQPYI